MSKTRVSSSHAASFQTAGVLRWVSALSAATLTATSLLFAPAAVAQELDPLSPATESSVSQKLVPELPESEQAAPSIAVAPPTIEPPVEDPAPVATPLPQDEAGTDPVPPPPSAPAAPPAASEAPADRVPKTMHVVEEDPTKRLLTPRSQTRQGDIKVKLVTVQLADRTDSISRSAAKVAIQTSSAYWKDMTNGRVTMSVASTQSHRSAAKSTWNYWDIMEKVTDELDWDYSPYTALVVFIPTDLLSHGAWGVGWSAANGTTGRILMPKPNSWNLSNNVMTHEFGHVLGLMHADSLECKNGASDAGTKDFTDGTCKVREYGDTTDVMGKVGS